MLVDILCDGEQISSTNLEAIPRVGETLMIQMGHIIDEPWKWSAAHVDAARMFHNVPLKVTSVVYNFSSGIEGTMSVVIRTKRSRLLREG